MSLTPMEIHNKEFARGFRGYNEDEVDTFLDKVVEEFEKMYKENMEMRERISMLNDQISQFKTMENTLKETLLTAQKTADDVVANAQKKGELLIKDAENHARRMIEDANKEVLTVKKEFDDVRRQAQIFKTRFKTLLETQLEMVLGDKELSGE